MVYHCERDMKRHTDGEIEQQKNKIVTKTAINYEHEFSGTRMNDVLFFHLISMFFLDSMNV